MTGYVYRLPRKYRYRGKGSDRDKVIGLLIGSVLVLGAASQGHVAAARHGGRPEAAAAVPSVSVTGGSNVAIGQRIASAYGWGAGSEWSCLYALWDHESGWRMVWNTAGSGAYGIPQALPASKMATAGADYMTSPATQIRWGLGYIRGRYGTPCGAWAFETSHVPNWY